MTEKIGLYIGRFQPFHNGHFDAIKQMKAEGVTKIIIGIGSCQESQTARNPLSFEERKTMITLVLPNVKIVAIPDFNNLKLWSEYIIKNLPKFDVLYSGNPWTKKAFSNTGVTIKSLEKNIIISATIIRDKIRNKEKIDHLVPTEVKKYLEEIELSSWLSDIEKTIKIAADGIIEQNKKIVLIKRRFEPVGYALPGGFIEYGETAENAMIREMKEETNLEVTSFKLHGIYSDPVRDPRGHVISTVFIAQAKGNLQAGDDAKETILVTPKEALKLNLAFDHNKIIQDYINKKKI